MNKHLTAAGAALSLLGAALPAAAAVSLTSVAAGYSQSFDSLATAGTTTVSNLAWANDSTLAGWSLYTATGSGITTYAAGTGSSNSGAFYSFGAANSNERALGGVGSGGSYFGSPASGAVAGYIVLGVTNNTGLTLDSATVRFDGEQWRNGGNTTLHNMAVEHRFGASYAAAGWSAPSVAWTAPLASASAAPVDGNGAGLVAGVSYGISTLWAPGETLWLRWTERNEAGSDHGLAIDNLTLSVTAVPEPGAAAMLLAGLGALVLLARRRA